MIILPRQARDKHREALKKGRPCRNAELTANPAALLLDGFCPDSVSAEVSHRGHLVASEVDTYPNLAAGGARVRNKA